MKKEPMRKTIWIVITHNEKKKKIEEAKKVEATEEATAKATKATSSPSDYLLLWHVSKSTLQAFSILPLSFPFSWFITILRVTVWPLNSRQTIRDRNRISWRIDSLNRINRIKILNLLICDKNCINFCCYYAEKMFELKKL